MNETYEQEIDLKWLIYRVLRGWRPIVIWAIIIAIVTGIGSFGLNYLKTKDPEYIEAAEENFKREHASWVATGENLQVEMENLADAKAKQQEYNEKSVLMQINPLREYNGSMELYVDYNYQIMPDMQYQNIDLSNRILKAYATYMTNGELYQYIIDNVSYDIELRYLKEIIWFSVDYGNNMISFSAKHQSAESCKELLDLARAGIMTKFEDVCNTIANHGIIDINATSYETVNLSLEETQKANKKRITELDIATQEVNEEYAEWKKEPEPEANYTFTEIVKSAIKMLIIGGVVGAVLVAVIIAFAALLSGKLLNPEDVKNRFGMRVIGQLPAKRVKKPFAFVSRWFAKFGGITATPEDYDRLAKMVGTSIKSDVSARAEAADWKKVAFTGTIAAEELEAVVASLGMDASLSAICAPDVLTNAESIQKLSEADCVVLVEKQEVSTLADITKEIEALKAWNKTVLGAVVVNADAVM